MKISKKIFGILSSGEKVFLYTLKAGDLSLSISSLGAAWTSLIVPSRKNIKEDVLLGFSTLESYTNKTNYMGATIGRFGNRIGKGVFTLNGKTCNLYKNDGIHTLHGGRAGFDRIVWKADAYEERDGIFVRFELLSLDGDEGYPGKCKATVCYGLTKSNEIVVDYEAKLDAPCPINLTNHSYYNLAGEGKGDILSHEVTLYSSSYIEVDDTLIPTGKLIPVSNTPFDFRSRKPVKRDINAAGGGYDHCFTVDGTAGGLRPAAEVCEPVSGRTMKVFTTQPGIQFYTGNFLDNMPGKMGAVYNKHAGFCLETQHFPDSPNRPEFPSSIYGPDRDYHEKALFSFSW
jgi:aldose 1-epimerase